MLLKEGVVQLFKAKPKFLENFAPKFEIAEGRKFRTAGGIAYVELNTISIAEWILADLAQTKLIIRHELSHLLHHGLGTGGTAHGKEFRAVLKLVSGKNYKQDMHWHPTLKINQARKKLRLPKA